jgi:hypothetical protein
MIDQKKMAVTMFLGAKNIRCGYDEEELPKVAN